VLGGDLAGEQQRGGRDQHPGHHGDDPVDACPELRARQREAARPLGQPRRVRVAADPGGAVAAAAGDHEAAGEDLLARALGDRLRLAGQHRLVDLEPGRVQHLAVDHHLVARADLEEVVQHDLADLDLAPLAVAEHVRARRVHQLQPLERPLGADLLDDADQDVGHQHDPEQRVLDRPDHQDHREQRAEQDVEAGDHVGADDLAEGPGGRLGDVVGEPSRDALGDLGAAQPRLLALAPHTPPVLAGGPTGPRGSGFPARSMGTGSPRSEGAAHLPAARERPPQVTARLTWRDADT
jgi:hypothetical protein